MSTGFFANMGKLMLKYPDEDSGGNPPNTHLLLLETGSYLLQEDGVSRVILEP